MRVRSTRSLIPQTVSVPGYNHFLTPLRKVIIDYDPYSIHQDGVRWVLIFHIWSPEREHSVSCHYLAFPLFTCPHASPTLLEDICVHTDH